ncbi:MAG: YfhO family protein, partial [Flavobacteriales bacterium]|nr:YfhO family protein [Flavobacteriales bacterium]
SYGSDSTATISLVQHKPNYLKYKSQNNVKGFAVFSEIYYGHGWKTLIDGQETTHTNVNYVLRGMQIPEGNHTIEFKFEPQVVKTGSSIALASSVLVGILIILGLFYQIKFKSNNSA